jgi:hypothetical protein
MAGGKNVPVECRRTANPSRQEPLLYHQVGHEMSDQVGLTCVDANDCHLIEKQSLPFCNAGSGQLLCH